MRARLAALLLGAAASLGAGPGLWRHPAPGEIPAGVPEDVSLSAEGALLLAPASEEILPGKDAYATPPLLLSVATDVEGNTYFGGGLGARVLRVDDKGEIHTFFESSGVGVRALSSDVSGYLLVATLPNGRVYRVDGDGNTEVLLEPEARYLWAMATDAFDRTYLATGEQGIIYTISGPGEATVFFDSDESHITSLATDPGGMLLAGSSGRGILYRIPPEGQAEVILNSGLSEISSIVVASDGTIYASAILDPGPRRPRKRAEERDELTIEIKPSGEDEVLEEAAESGRKVVIDLGEVLPAVAEGAESRTVSRVYRISPGRTPKAVWSSSSEWVYSVALDSRGHLLMGTGPSGRLYRLEPDGSATLVRRYPATHVTSLAQGSKGGTWVLTSNPGRVYRMDPAPAESGHYLSPIHDAGNVASWGTLRWNADLPKGTRIAFASRSGNTPTPDETWHLWSDSVTEAGGSAVQSPPSRYIQWRATLSRLKTETTPVLREAILTYLPENLPPEVRSVQVRGPGEAPTGSRDEREDRSGEDGGEDGKAPRLLWISWTSSDPDGDPLVHSIAIRRQEETSWMPLAREVERQRISLDPSGHPEGRYVARVVADDGKVNGNRRGLQASARSTPFVVDNSPPELEMEEPDMGEESFTLTFSATDALSPLESAEWSADPDGPWHAVFPRDGIPDTVREVFDLSLPLEGMSRQLHIRVTDGSGNRSIREVTLPRWQ